MRIVRTGSTASRPRPATQVVALVAAMLAVSACGANPATPTPMPSPTPTQAATPTPTPTPSPTPGPTPVDAAPAFVRTMTSPTFSGAADLTGTVTVGVLSGTASGTLEIGGGNSSSTTRMTIGGTTSVNDSISIGPDSWTRSEPGPWLVRARTSKGSLAGLLAKVSSVTDVGVESRANRQLHHLRPASGNTIDPITIGFDVANATGASFTLDFFATEDGTPAVMALAGSWTQTIDGQAYPATMALDYAFRDVGRTQDISAPVDVWDVYTSQALHYTMAHPAGWTVKRVKTTDEYQSGGTTLLYMAQDAIPKVMTIEGFRRALKVSYKKPFGAPVSEAKRQVGGTTGYRLTFKSKDASGKVVWFADDIAVHGGKGWEIATLTLDPTADLPILDEFTASFAFTS